MMKLYEMILLIIFEFGGKLSGRTKIQKICYFYSQITGKKMGFKPHFYGPYSPLVENTLDELEGIGLIDKTVERLGESPDGFEVKRYHYEITKYGQQVVDTIGDTEERDKLKNFLEKIKDIGLPNTMDISIAAKAYYILHRENKPLTSEEIRKKAESFGWDIDFGSIDKAVSFLNELELIHR